MLNRINLYDGGVVELVKTLSSQDLTTDEILAEINKKFPNLPTGRKGKPSDKSGVMNILKKELGPELYKERFSPKRITPETIEKFKKLRETMSETDIAKELGISTSYQTKLAKELGLPSKAGKPILSKLFTQTDSVGTAIKNRIDPTNSAKVNFDYIYPDIKDKKFRTGTNRITTASVGAIKKGINSALMEANQLSVDEYKNEIRKMVEDRNYAPKGLDPLGIKTKKLTNYPIPNYLKAKQELRSEIPELDKRLNTNISRRKRLTAALAEIEEPQKRIVRLAKKSLRKEKSRLANLGLTTKLTPREQAIKQAQNINAKMVNDKIKKNPEIMIKYLENNPEKLKALGTRINRQTGEIFYENPNLEFLNTDSKDTARFFEIDHGREISKQAGKLVDTPENRNLLPRNINSGFKRDAEIFIENNPDPTNPKVRAILDKAQELSVRIRPNVEPGIFKASDFFQPFPHPIVKINDAVHFYSPVEFHPTETIFPRDNRGRIITGLNEITPAMINVAKGFLKSKTGKSAVGLSLGALFAAGAAGAAEPKPVEMEKPQVAPLGELEALGQNINVKPFDEYNPETYPSNEEQKVNLENYANYILAAGAAAGATQIPRGYNEARALGRGKFRSAIGITGGLGKVLTATGTPGVAIPYEVTRMADKISKGASASEILMPRLEEQEKEEFFDMGFGGKAMTATKPLIDSPYLSLAFLEPLSKTTGVITKSGEAAPGILSKVLRLGLNPRTIAGISRFAGLPGLALSAGLTAYDLYQTYQNRKEQDGSE